MVVVIFGEAEPTTEQGLVRRAVEKRGVETAVLDVFDWAEVSPVEYAVGGGDAVLGESIPLDQVTGVFSMDTVFADESAPMLYDLFERKEVGPAYNQVREWHALYRSLLGVFSERGANVILAPPEPRWDRLRPWMLTLFDGNDVPIPETTFTNDPGRVRAFLDEHGRAVVQEVNGGSSPEVLRADDLDPDRLETLATAPIKLQEYVPGDDVRAYVLDGELVGAIRFDHDADAISHMSPDVDPADVGMTAVTPDPEFRDVVERVGELTPSPFATVDLRVTGDGDVTVLESNTTGLFAAPDNVGETNVSGAIAEFLTAGEATA